MHSKEINLGTMPIKKLFLLLAIPSIISQLFNALYNLMDRMYIGHIPEIGANALTSVGICLPIIMFISAFASLIAIGGAPRASIFLGQQKKEEAEKVLGNCFSALLITAGLLTLALYVFKTPLLYLFGASDHTIALAKDYLNIYLIGTLPIQITVGMNMFIIAQGHSKVGMKTIMIGAITNIILDPIFIFVFHLGVKGAAIATIISQSIAALWVLNFLRSSKSTIRLQKEYMPLQKHIILPCLALGVAPFIMQATESIIVLCFNSSLLAYGGDLAVGTMTILSSLLQFSMMPLTGFAQGAQPIISFNLGAKNKQRLKQAFMISFTCCVIYSFLLFLAVMITPQTFASLFTPDPTLLQMASWALRIYMFGCVIFGAQIACQQAFIALGNAKISAFLALFRKVILLIPLIYILPLFTENKVVAVFMAEPIADMVAVIVTTTIFFVTFKKLLNSLDTDTSLTPQA